ncbi:MAG: hypothetical protein WC623_24115 [Pedobacter sp.]
MKKYEAKAMTLRDRAVIAELESMMQTEQAIYEALLRFGSEALSKSLGLD